MAPGSHIVIDDCPGLRLVASIKSKTWIYRYRSPIDQKLRQIKIGRWPAVSEREACNQWQQLVDQRQSGCDPVLDRKLKRAELATASPAGYTVADLVEDYATGYLNRNREPKGAKATKRRLISATTNISELSITDITRKLAFSVIESLMDRPVLASSVKVELAAAWRYAKEAGSISSDAPNWWAEKSTHKFRSKGAIRDGKHKGTSKRVLLGKEIKTLIVEDLALFSQQVRDFLIIQLWTCTRGGEICQMKRSQIAKESDTLWWTIPKAESKTRHSADSYDLRVPLVGRAEKVVARLLKNDGDLLFPSKGRDGVIKSQTQAYMGSKVHYLQPYSKSKPEHKRKRLQVTHWSPHDLRRTGRTLLASIGCPHEIGEAVLGHVLPGVAGDYNRYRYDKERLAWLINLDALYESFVAA